MANYLVPGQVIRGAGSDQPVYGKENGQIMRLDDTALPPAPQAFLGDERAARIGAVPRVNSALPVPKVQPGADAAPTNGIMEFLMRLFNGRQTQLDGVMDQLGATPGGKPVDPAIGGVRN